MKKRLFIGILMLSNLFVFGQEKLEIEMVAPQIKFISSLPADYQIPKDKPILIDFWATWCGPCIAGLLETNELIDEYSDKIEFIAMTDPTSRKVYQFVNSKKFKHKFLFDSTNRTFNDYDIHSIPHAVLIDKNGIIQWTGNGSYVTKALLDEFLLNNSIAEKTNNFESYTSSRSKTKKDSLVNHDISLIISEKEILNPVTSFSGNLKSDTFQFNAFNQPIKRIIYNLYNDQENRIIYRKCNTSMLKKNISITYKTTNVDVEKEKLKLINFIGNQYKFKAETKLIDTSVWVLSVINNDLLQKNKSISVGKTEEITGGIYLYHDRGSNSLKLINSSLKLLCEFLENDFGLFCKTECEDDLGYDFYNVDCPDATKLFVNLEREYGIKATREDIKLPFLIVTAD